MLLGCKADLAGTSPSWSSLPTSRLAREVSDVEAKEWANQKGMHYFECSAKTGAGIREAIDSALEKAYGDIRIPAAPPASPPVQPQKSSQQASSTKRTSIDLGQGNAQSSNHRPDPEAMSIQALMNELNELGIPKVRCCDKLLWVQAHCDNI